MPTDSPSSLPSDRSLADALARGAAGMLGTDNAAALASALAAGVGAVADYEASARGTADGRLRAGRMMIERASPRLFPAIASALDVTLPSSADRWIESALRERVPMIAGWDLRAGTAERCVKLYVNASDAAREARTRLRDALAPGLAHNDEPPAVLGMNVRADGVTEAKFYVQSADAVELAEAHGARAQQLARAARSEQADAGGVLSLDASEGELKPRAFFVALREPPSDTPWRCVSELPGYDERDIAGLLPFPPAPPRSVGVSLGDGSWTLYFKPLASMRAPEALEPTASFRAGEAEVGVFVEPTEHAARAFRRTDRYAVSIRIREGEPTPRSLEALVDWFTSRLRIAEGNNGDVTANLADPPAPWTVVDAAWPFEGRGGRP